MKLTLTLIISLAFIVGCGTRSNTIRIIEKKPEPMIEKTQPKIQKKPIRKVKRSKLPPPPKKIHKPKKVEDTNYSDNYMYPEDGKAAKKDPKVKKEPVINSKLMTKEECISMIGQEKFDKYTSMFGSEAASLKRCTMLKAMKK